MKVALMQPYFLPYLGYFQLMKVADIFVYYDDVTFIKQSWINRNKILLNGKEYLFTLELKEVSSYKNINTIQIGSNRLKLLKTFIHAYKKAPYFKFVEPVLYSIFESKESNLTNYIIYVNELIFKYLNINIEFLISSEIKKDNTLKGERKVINICNHLNASTYINSIGGIHLYSRDIFKNNGINLKFLQPRNIEYVQYNQHFISNLSVIDVIMFNSKNQISDFLLKYDLI